MPYSISKDYRDRSSSEQKVPRRCAVRILIELVSEADAQRFHMTKRYQKISRDTKSKRVFSNSKPMQTSEHAVRFADACACASPERPLQALYHRRNHNFANRIRFAQLMTCASKHPSIPFQHIPTVSHQQLQVSHNHNMSQHVTIGVTS